MHVTKWETAKVARQCTGCDVHVLPGSRYLQTKFTLDEDNNLSKLVTVYLCERFIDAFALYAESDPEPTNDNPEPPRRA